MLAFGCRRMTIDKMVRDELSFIRANFDSKQARQMLGTFYSVAEKIAVIEDGTKKEKYCREIKSLLDVPNPTSTNLVERLRQLDDKRMVADIFHEVLFKANLSSESYWDLRLYLM